MPASLGTFSQTRTTEAANEVTGTSGGGFAGTDYDAAGNQTAGPKTGAESTQIGYVYDGWNRLVGVDANHDGDLYDAGDVRYRYDGTGRRITKFTDNADDGTNASGSTEEYYQNEQNQVLEVRIGTVTGGVKTINANPKERYLWDANYIDEPAMVELDTNTDGTRDYRLWPTTDANHNVTGLLSDKGVTVERYAYTPYGERIVLNGDQNYANTGPDADGAEYTVDTNGSDFGFLLGFQGLRFNPESGDWETDSRLESPNFGFIQRDPLGTTAYATQGMNLVQFVRSNPITFTDPSGNSSDDGDRLSNDLAAMNAQVMDWLKSGYTFAASLMQAFMSRKFLPAGNGKFGDAKSAFNAFAGQISSSKEYRNRAQDWFQGLVEKFYTKPGTYDLPNFDPRPPQFHSAFKINYGRMSNPALYFALGGATFGYTDAKLTVTPCSNDTVNWSVSGTFYQTDLYYWKDSLLFQLDDAYAAGRDLQESYGFAAFWHSENWSDSFSGSAG